MDTFDAWPLRPELAQALRALGLTHPTPVQAAALPAMLAGRDVVAQAATGSGKTVAFGVAALQRLAPERPVAQALVLCPTRELAAQVAEVLRGLARRMANTRVVTLVGGVPMRPQRLALEHGPQVIVGTPGRVADHVRAGRLALDGVAVVVLDEADRLLDLGFTDEVAAILAATPARRQTLLLSATFPPAVEALAAAGLADPARVTVGGAPEQLQQQVVLADGDRAAVVGDLLAEVAPAAALVFTETRADADHLAAALAARGASAVALHGDLSQPERSDRLTAFALGCVRVVVATDVAARGLDVAGLPLVVIAELSRDPAAHVHRVGRTGRAGGAGLAVSVVIGHTERERLARIEAAHGAIAVRPAPAPSPSLAGLASAWRAVRLLAGRRDKLRKGDVVGALVGDAGLPVAAVGAIALEDRSCTVALAAEHAAAAMRHLRIGAVKGRRIRAEWV